MLPLHTSGLVACTYHVFYNSPQLTGLVATQVLAPTRPLPRCLTGADLCSWLLCLPATEAVSNQDRAARRGDSRQTANSPCRRRLPRVLISLPLVH